MNPRTQISFFAAIFFAIALNAEPKLISSDKEEILLWPAYVKIKYAYETTEIFSDGLEYRYYLSTKSQRFEMENYGKWRKGPSKPDKSVVLSWKEDPKIEFSLTEFSHGEFMDNLDEETWNAYKRGILQNHPDATIIDDRRGIDTLEPPFPPSRDYRVLRYSYRKSPKEVFIDQQVFFSKDGRIYAYVFSGPAGFMEDHIENHSLIVTRIAYTKLDEKSG